MTNPSNQNEPPDRFEDADKYTSLIAIIRASTLFQPSESFTERVMAQLSGHMRIQSSVARAHAPSTLTQVWQKFWPGKIQVTDCAFCFVLSGFFYLIISITLVIGLKPISATLPAGSWLAFQPFFSFCFAVILTCVGILIVINRPMTRLIARLGTMGYLFFSLINGLLSHWIPGAQLGPVGLLFYISGAALLGMFLLVTLHKCQSHGPMQPCDPQC